jgi:hypothetical protein
VNSNEAVLAVIDALHASDVDYMLVGSLASNLYGIARSTNDADFVVQLGDTPMLEVARWLGPQFRFDPQRSFEGITATTRYVIEALELAFKIEFFLLSDDPYDQSRFARRRRIPMLGREAFVLSVEDVLVTKLRWSKEGRRVKDREDVANVLSVFVGEIDWTYVYHWCQEHHTVELLNEIRNSLPPI